MNEDDEDYSEDSFDEDERSSEEDTPSEKPLDQAPTTSASTRKRGRPAGGKGKKVAPPAKKARPIARPSPPPVKAESKNADLVAQLGKLGDADIEAIRVIVDAMQVRARVRAALG